MTLPPRLPLFAVARIATAFAFLLALALISLLFSPLASAAEGDSSGSVPQSMVAWPDISGAASDATLNIAESPEVDPAAMFSGAVSLVHGDASVPPPAGTPFMQGIPVPARQVLPSAHDPWGHVEFEDGTVSYHLVGRGNVVSTAVDGANVGMELADGRSQLIVGDTWGSEEWIVTPDGGDLWSLALSWAITVPDGWSVSLSDHPGAGDELILADQHGWTRMTVNAPSYVDETGAKHPLAMSWNVSTGQMTVSATPIADGAVGDIAIDPVWSKYGSTDGWIQYQACPGAVQSGTACSLGTPASHNNWAYDGSSSYGLDFNYGSTSTWGRYVSGKHTTINANAYVRNLYYVPGNLVGQSINWKGNFLNPSGSFTCDLQGIASGSTVDTSTAVAVGDFNKSMSRTTPWTVVGLRMKNTSGAAFTPSAGDNHRCTMDNSAGGYVNIVMIDNYSPMINSPETDPFTAVHWGSSGYWYNSTSAMLAFGWTTSDSGSGSRRIYPVINGTVSAAGTNDPCLTQDGMLDTPCPLGSQSGVFAWKMTNSSAWVQGVNWIDLEAEDYSKQSRVSTRATPATNYILLDTTTPSAPTLLSPDNTSTSTVVSGSGNVTLSWTPVTDSGSGIQKYLVCASKIITGCDDGTAGSPSAFRFASTTSSITAKLGTGKWYWRVRAVDIAENVSAVSNRALINIDAHAPTTSMTSPAPTLSVRTTGAQTFAATASDDDGDSAAVDATVASVAWQYRRSDSADWNATPLATDNTSPYSASASLSMGDGEYELRAKATDSLTNPNVGISDEQSLCLDVAALGQPQTAKYRLNGTPVVSGEVWWTPPTTMTGVVGYLVERHDNVSGTWQVIARTGLAENSASDPAATATTDSYRVESIGQACTTTPMGNGTVATSDSAGTSVAKPYGTIRVGEQSYWQSVGVDVGANATASANIAGGNMAVVKPLAAGPGAGISATPVLIHNSQERGAHSSALALDGLLGEGWTLGLANISPEPSISSMTGVSMDPIVTSGSTITARDQDGTPLVFNAGSGGLYTAPAGTFLRLRDWQAAGESDPGITGAVITGTRPDRVSFYWARPGGANPVEDDGRLIAIRDRDGRGLTINYDCVQVDDTSHDVEIVGAGACPAPPAPTGYVYRYRPSGISNWGTDGTAGVRTYQLSYFDRAPVASDRALDGRLSRLTDFAGRYTDVDYDRTTSGITVSPRLHVVTDAATTSTARTTTFEHDLADDTATRWVDESQLITRITDGRGSSTKIAYTSPDNEDLPRVSRITDRAANAAGREAIRMNYGVTSGALDGATTVIDQLNHSTVYKWDSQGRVVDTILPTGDTNRSEYNSNSQVTKKLQVLREDEAVTLSAAAPTQALAETSIAPYVEVRVRTAKNQGGTLYTEGAGADYTLNRTSPASITRTSTSSIPSGGATVYVTYIAASTLAAYDSSTGYPLTIQAAKGTATTPGELAPATAYTYTNSAMGGQVADIATVTTPRGNATTSDADDFQTTYAYDSNLRVSQISTPINQSTGDTADISAAVSEYYSNGDLKSQSDGMGVVTGYSNYDASGQAQYEHVPTTGTFDPATTPVATVSLYDAMGGQTCSDDKQESGDSIALGACVWPTSTYTNTDFSTKTYDALGRVNAVTAPLSATKRSASTAVFDADDNAVTITSSIAYDPDPSDPWGRLSPSAGMVTTHTYDAMGRETIAQLPANDDDHTERIAQNIYDAAGNLVTEVQPEGIFSVLNSDYLTTHIYDASNREIGVIDGVGGLSCNYFDRIGNTIANSEPMALSAGVSTCPSSAPSTWTTTRTIDRAGRTLSETDPTGKVLQMAYDDEDNVTSNTDNTSATSTQSVSADGNALSVTGPARTICNSATVCDSGHQSSIAPTTTYSYTKGGQVASVTDARKQAEGGATGTFTNAYSYDQNGNLATMHLADDGSVTAGDDNQFIHQSHSYDGQLTAATLQSEVTTAPTDAQTQGCKTGATYANGIACKEITTWNLTADGSIAKKADDATNTESTNTYNGNGQLATRTEHGVTTTFTYYDDGSPRTETKATLPADYAVSTLYAVGQCVKPTGVATLYIVTASAGFHKSAATAPGSWPSSGSVVNGDITFTVSTCTETTQHYYDRNGAEVKTVQSHSTSSVPTETYQVIYKDGIGRPTRVLNFDGTYTEFTYDRAGNTTKETVEGRTTNWTYGTSGATTGMVTSESMAIDSSSPSISASFTYDSAGRLATVRRSTSPYPTWTTYSYDAAGNQTNAVTQLYTSGGSPLSGYVLQNVDYVYDADGRLRVRKERSRRTNPAKKWTASTALALGTIVEPVTPNSHQYIVTTAGTTAATEPSWPTGEKATVASSTVTFTELTAITEYTYDGQGRLVKEVRPDNPATAVLEGERDYEFDNTGRIDTITTPCTGGTGRATLEDYAYSSSDPSIPVSLEKNYLAGPACSTLTDQDNLTINSSQGTGQEGALTSVVSDPGAVGGTTTTTTYRHDEDNLLATTAVGAATNEVTTRDATGRPEKDTADTGEVAYQYAANNPEPAGIGEANDEAPAGFLTDPNGHNIGVLYLIGSRSQYIVSDQQNTSTMVLDGGAVILNTQDYDAYGQAESLMASGNPAVTTFGYTGVRTDPQTGLIDHQARSYSPLLRSWITTDQYTGDPTQDQGIAVTPQNQLRLAYGGFDPVNGVDQDGHYMPLYDSQDRMIGRIDFNSRGYTVSTRSFTPSGVVYHAPIRMPTCRETASCRAMFRAKKKAAKTAERDSCHTGGGRYNSATGECITPAMAKRAAAAKKKKQKLDVHDTALGAAMMSGKKLADVGKTVARDNLRRSMRDPNYLTGESYDAIQRMKKLGMYFRTGNVVVSGVSLYAGYRNDGARGVGRGLATIAGGALGGAGAAATGCLGLNAIPGWGTAADVGCGVVGGVAGGIAAGKAYDWSAGSQR